jgi:hypothetical protein
MKTATYVCAAAVIIFSAPNSNAQTASVPDVVKTASAFEWTTPNANRLKALFQDKAAVAALENQTLDADDRALSTNSIGEYEILDLNNDGHLELLCTVDASGRTFYTALVAFSEQNGKIARSDVSTNGANFVNFGGSISDLHHDGMKEILVPHLLGMYRGAELVAELPDVYQFHHGRLVRVSEQFSDYYTKRLLPHLMGTFDAVAKEPRSVSRQKQKAVIQQEINAIKSAYGE